MLYNANFVCTVAITFSYYDYHKITVVLDTSLVTHALACRLMDMLRVSVTLRVHRFMHVVDASHHTLLIASHFPP